MEAREEKTPETAAPETETPTAASERDTDLDRAAAEMGLRDPVTGEPVRNQAELDRWLEQQEHRSDQRERSRRARAEERRAMVDRQLAEIARLDPTVRGLGDLTRSEQYETIYALVKRGNSLVDAYKLANFDRLTRRAAESARQRVLNELEGKRHLAATQQRGEGASPVPPEVAEQYRLINPGITEAEMRRHYNRGRRK